MQAHPAIDLFRTLLSVPAPSGREEKIAALIKAELDALSCDYTQDSAGNLIVSLNGRSPAAPLTCYAAHMDEIGFVVTAIKPNGSLQVRRSGGLLPWKAGELPVELLTDAGSLLNGILSMGSTHTQAAGDQKIDWSQVRILTGLTPNLLHESGVRIGTLGVPARHVCQPVIFGPEADPLVGAWTFDDRLGCVTLLRLLRWLKENDVTPAAPSLIAFTTREEVGGHGAKFLAQTQNPAVFIAIDGAPIPPGSQLALDGRPAVWSKDRLAPYDHQLLQAIRRAGDDAGVDVQTAVYEAAASDASLVSYAGLAGRVACFGQVRENSHGFEVIRLSVADNMLATLRTFVERWAG